VRWVKALFWVVAILLAIPFLVQNRTEVTLRFVFPWENIRWFGIPEVSLPLFLVVLCSIALGILIGGVGDMYSRFQLRKMLRQNQKTIDRLEKEMQSLRGPSLDQAPYLKKEV
jgi:putative membrane protein